MKKNDLHTLFIDELAGIYDSEKQIIEALPKLIELASIEDLKEALSSHLQETKKQMERIEQIFAILNLQPDENRCEGMEGLLKEAGELVNNKEKSPLLDAAIISAAQKVEHYEIASYGTLHSFAKHLDLDVEIADLLLKNLEEEGAADKKLTKIADGSFFSSGVNKKAAI